jgi:group I intron endonuclease
LSKKAASFFESLFLERNMDIFDDEYTQFVDAPIPLIPLPSPIWVGSTTKIPEYILKLNNVIYKYTSPSGKSYVGQTKNFERRHAQHRSKKGNKCQAFYNAISKYGFDKFELAILAVFETPDELNDAEIFAIEKENTLAPNGYNLTSGGSGLSNPSAETREKISKSKIGNKTFLGKKHTTATKEKMSKAAQNRSMETLAKISKALTGRKLTTDTKNKLSKAHLGKKHTTEAKEKMSKRMLGNKFNLGKKATEQTRAKMSISSRTIQESEDLPQHAYLLKRKDRENMIVVVAKPGHAKRYFGSSAPLSERKKMAIAYMASLDEVEAKTATAATEKTMVDAAPA